MVETMKKESVHPLKDYGMTFIFDVYECENMNDQNEEEKLYSTYFVSSKKRERKVLSIMELEKEIRNCRRVKMIMIENGVYGEVYSLLCKISKERGICSPIIELEKALLFFPELRYSDMGLLDYICEQNSDIKNYSLKMSGSGLIGGAYV